MLSLIQKISPFTCNHKYPEWNEQLVDGWVFNEDTLSKEYHPHQYRRCEKCNKLETKPAPESVLDN